MGAAIQQKPSLFIQFAGQGVKYMDDLRRLYHNYPDVQPFITDCINTIQHEYNTYDDSETCFFSKGLSVEKWLFSPEKTPDDGYLLSSPLSHPLIYLTQVANYLSLILEGVDQSLLIRNTHSATGFSTGVVAALLVSLDLPLDQFISKALKAQSLFFWQGIRTQQAMFNNTIFPEIVTHHMSTPEGSKSCMASITNILKKQLDHAIESFNGASVYPAYELFPGRWVVAGKPDDLEQFRLFIKTKNDKYEWRFIPSTIAAHSPYLNYALQTSPSDAENLGLSFEPQKMKIPVLSNSDGVDLRTSSNIIHDVMTAYFTKTAIWKKQIAPLMTSPQIRYVLDFGPGTGVASLTENFTTRSGIKVIRCTNPLGRKQFFNEVLPGLQ